MDVDEVWEQLRIPSSCGKLLWQALRPVLREEKVVWGLAQ